MDWLTDPQVWIGFLTLTVLEIVLGIDNIVFISILAGRLPADTRERARRTGIMAALFSRLALLTSIGWLAGLTTPLLRIEAAGFDLTGRDLVLLAGGLFLIAKATMEIHHKLEGVEGETSARVPPSFAAVIGQIMVIDVVFSLDSVITAVGMVNNLPVMVAANVVALGFMLLFARPIADFVEDHPTVKMLALAFLIMIGVNLIADGLHHHIPKGYTYFAMAFSVAVEMLNLKLRARSATPVRLHQPITEGPAGPAAR